MRIGSRIVKVPVNYGNVPEGTPQGSVIAIERDCDDHLEAVTIRWDDGQIENTPICSEHSEILDVTPELYLNLYVWDREYGGPEEGGWWYNTYAPATEHDWWRLPRLRWKPCKLGATSRTAPATHPIPWLPMDTSLCGWKLGPLSITPHVVRITADIMSAARP